MNATCSGGASRSWPWWWCASCSPTRPKRRSISGSTCAAASTWCSRSRPTTRCGPRPTRTWRPWFASSARRASPGSTVRRLENSKFEATGIPAERRAAVDKVVETYLPFWTFDRRSAVDRLRAQARGGQRDPRPGGAPGPADDRQPDRRLRRLRAGDPAAGPRLQPHRAPASRRRRSRARQGADQEHRVPRVPLRRLPAAGRRGVRGRDPAELRREAPRRRSRSSRRK